MSETTTVRAADGPDPTPVPVTSPAPASSSEPPPPESPLREFPSPDPPRPETPGVTVASTLSTETPLPAAPAGAAAVTVAPTASVAAEADVSSVPAGNSGGGAVVTTSEPKPPAPPRREIPPEALEFLPDALMIEERPLPLSARMTLYMLLILVITGVTWAGISEIDRIVTARGRFVTTPPSLVVQPMETSILRTLEVNVGQTVKKGQLLATLDPTFARSDLAQLEVRLRSAAAQVARLEAEMDGKPYVVTAEHDPDQQLQRRLWLQRQAQYRARLDSLDEGVARRQAAIATNQRDLEVLKARHAGLREIETMRSDLLRNQNASRLSLLETIDTRLEVERDLETSTLRTDELRHDLANAEAERGAFIEEWRQKGLEELVQARRERDQVAEQLEKAQRRSQLVDLYSPAEGIVQEVARKSAGSVIREAEPVVTLVPLDTPLEAELRIEARDIGFVREGDPVRLKVDAFPFQKHGTINGTLRALSQDAFTRDNASIAQQPPPEHGAEAYYVARVAFDPNTKLREVPESTRFIPGMTLAGEIVVGQRGVLTYFLYPVLRVFDESIREP